MLARYRRVKTTNKLITFALLEVFLGVVAWRYNYSILLLVGLPALLLTLFDFAVTRTRYFLAIAVGAGQLIIATLLSSTVFTVITAAGGNDYGLSYTLTQVFFLFALLVAILLSIYAARGRVWLNLLLASLIFDAAHVTTMLLSGGYVLALLIAFGAMGIFFLLRSIRYHRRAIFTLPNRAGGVVRRAQDFFEEQGYTVYPVGDKAAALDFVAYNATMIHPVFVIDIHNTLVLGKNELLADGKPVTQILEELLLAGHRWGRANHIGREYLTPLVYTAKAIQPASRTVSIKSRRRPDHKLGTVYLVNRMGVEKLRRGTRRMNELPARITRRLVKLDTN